MNNYMVVALLLTIISPVSMLMGYSIGSFVDIYACKYPESSARIQKMVIMIAVIAYMI